MKMLLEIGIVYVKPITDDYKDRLMAEIERRSKTDFFGNAECLRNAQNRLRALEEEKQ